MPLFLANGAIAAFIKFYNNSPPAILVAILHGLAVLYLLVAHARWFKHLFAVPERENLEVVCYSPRGTQIYFALRATSQIA